MLFSISLQDSMSPLMNQIIFFHDHVMMVMIMILSSVVYMILSIILIPSQTRSLKTSESLEIIWTVLPCVVLTSLAAPSLTTLYLSDEILNPLTTIKIVGHQWFWSYEYEGKQSLSYDSYMKGSSDLQKGEFRLLEADKSVFFPTMNEIRLIVTSTDVIHSWTLPSMGSKMDAVPGRINQFYLYPSRVGVVYGQCSEICGSLHSFMPIKAELIPFDEFIKLIS